MKDVCATFGYYLPFGKLFIVCLPLWLLQACSVKAADPIAPPVEDIAPPVDTNAEFNASVARMDQSLLRMQTVLNNGVVANLEDAWTLAVATNRPLLRWVNVECQRCIKESQDEFVHMRMDSFEGDQTPRVIVSLPKSDGGLDRVGEVKWWITGDSTFGHLPSTRRLIQAHKSGGGYYVISEPPGMWSQPAMSWSPPPAPPIMVPQVQRVPVMRFQSPAVCAS